MVYHVLGSIELETVVYHSYLTLRNASNTFEQSPDAVLTRMLVFSHELFLPLPDEQYINTSDKAWQKFEISIKRIKRNYVNLSIMHGVGESSEGIMYLLGVVSRDGNLAEETYNDVLKILGLDTYEEQIITDESILSGFNTPLLKFHAECENRGFEVKRH